MDLPANLVKEFVKSTLDSTDDKKPSRFYGTADVRDDGIYVTLDGSSSVTPVSMVTDAMTGDRVLVEIVDHKARIIQNLDKSNSDIVADRIANDKTGVFQELRVGKEYVETLIANDITADSIVADRAKIGELEADNATINGKLTAQEASIGSLEADNATINGKLTAQEASIGSLETDNATINGKLTAQEAEISNLSGEFASFVSGDFGTLSADVADIQTLMFGSATGTTITSEFANTVVSHIGEAQIDSAMIKDLTFDKITGFDVNTTNLTIHSEDGKSQWHDNTIQISDANRVRVQIGKDASNDYSMYVWDAAGNLMFDALGLTGSGIQREIIRNDMVAEDAAINGSKLNIESVFREMDGSTYTLTSNHLTYDGKSLDLTLQSMSETDKEQGQLLSSQGTQITAIQGQIASKIWQQDIDTATGEMNTKYSELEQELGGFKTTVGETYSTKSDLNALTKRVETAETNISQNTEQISLRATKTEVATAKDEALNESKSYTDAQIKVSADGIESTVSSTYATKTENQAALDAANAVADDLTNNYSTTTEMNSVIDQKADAITSSVSKTYATKAENQATLDVVNNVKTTAEQTADKFTWLVESGTSSSNFTLTDRVASLLSSEFQIDALTTFKNSAIDGTSTVINGGAIKTGTIDADKLKVTDLNAIGATIGGFTIGNSAIYNGATSLAGADNSVYLGLDGISCGTKFKVDKKGVLSTADIKMEKTKTENNITSTFGTYISSPDTWTGDGFSVPEIKTRTTTIVDGARFSNELLMYPFEISLSKYATGFDNTWLRLEPTKISMFSYINDSKGFRCPELFIQPAGANNISSVTIGKEIHQIYSVEWTDDPYDYDDPLANCPHNMYPVTFNASTVTFNSAVNVLSSLKVNDTDVSLSGHRHSRLYNTANSSYEAQVALVLDGNYYYFRGSEASKYVCGSEVRPWYKTYTERLEVTKGKPVFTYVGSNGGGSAVSYAANMYINSTGIVSRTTKTSSRTIKHDITELQDEQIKAENLYNVNVYQAKYNEDILSDDDPRYLKDLPMFIIEDLDEKYPVVIDKPSENVKEWSWNAQYIIPPMLKLIQMQHEEIEAIKAELEEMRAS